MIILISDCATPVASTNSIDYARLSASASIVSVCIAGVVCLIAYWQWKTAREKLRLDLYNRRFDLYNKYLRFFYDLITWDVADTKLENATFDDFSVAFRESRFLFKNDSGVYESMERLFDHYSEMRAIGTDPKIASPDKMRRLEEKTELLIAERTHLKLEKQIAPYLNFHNKD